MGGAIIDGERPFLTDVMNKVAGQSRTVPVVTVSWAERCTTVRHLGIRGHWRNHRETPICVHFADWDGSAIVNVTDHAEDRRVIAETFGDSLADL